MELPWGTIMASALSFLSGGGGKWIVDLIKQKNEDQRQGDKQATDSRSTEIDKAIIAWKEIVADVKLDLKAMNEAVHVAEKERFELVEKNALLRGQLENAVQQRDYLQKQNDHLQARLDAYDAKSNGAAPKTA